MSDYTSTSKLELLEGWQQYVTGFADWKSFITLTSEEFVTRDQIEHKFRFLIQALNRDLFGNNYTRIVGHSYFSYACAVENQRRDVLHLHVLVDRRVNYSAIIKIWRNLSGRVMIDPVYDAVGVSNYLSKYVTKGGDLSLYKPAKVKEPAFKPMWYLGI